MSWVWVSENAAALKLGKENFVAHCDLTQLDSGLIDTYDLVFGHRIVVYKSKKMIEAQKATIKPNIPLTYLFYYRVYYWF